MIKAWLFLLLFFYSSLANNYILEQNYTYENSVIHAKDLFKEIPVDFEILRIPDDKTHFRIHSQIIAKSFELHGIAVDSSKVRYVNFTKKSQTDVTPFQEQLASALQERYPSMIIDEILITARGYHPSFPKGAKAVYEPKLFNSAKGTFYILDDQGVRQYLNYTVTATINVLHTTQKVSRKESLSGINTRLLRIPFNVFKDTPLTELPSDSYRFRSSLKENTLLTERNIEAIPLVLKGEKIIAVVRNGNVVVEFGAVSTQEGGVYDMITIQKSDGKRVKAKVIGEKRVELQ